MDEIRKKLKNGYIILMCSGESYIYQSKKLISIWDSGVYSVNVLNTKYDFKPLKIFDGNDFDELPKFFTDCSVKPIFEKGVWL